LSLKDFPLCALRKRYPNAHKGSFGRLLLIAGSETMTGCAVLAAQGALRSGVGILECAAVKECITVIQNNCFEAVNTPISDYYEDFPSCSARLLERIKVCDAVAMGPGLLNQDSDPARKELLAQLMLMLIENSRVNFVFDADCLTAMAPHLKEFSLYSSRIAITPHPGEMSRLCGVAIPAIIINKEKCASEFSREYGFVTLLKGNKTAVASPNGDIYINSTGNPFMARGGSGDVLTGIIGSLLAQGSDLFDGVCLGAYIHGGAADIAAEELGLSMLPSDIAPRIGKFIFSKEAEL